MTDYHNYQVMKICQHRKEKQILDARKLDLVEYFLKSLYNNIKFSKITKK